MIKGWEQFTLEKKIKRTNYVLLIQTRQAVDWGEDTRKPVHDYLKSINIKVEDELFRWVQGGDNFEIRGRKEEGLENNLHSVICKIMGPII